MDWSTVVKYFMEFIKWVWQNKFVTIFAITTIVFAIMYGCEKKELNTTIEKLEKTKIQLATCDKNLDGCESDIKKITGINNNMKISYDSCKKELEVVKESFKNSEKLNIEFEKQIEKYKDFAKKLDEEKDPNKQFEMKKKFLEELFKGTKTVKVIMSAPTCGIGTR